MSDVLIRLTAICVLSALSDQLISGSRLEDGVHLAAGLAVACLMLWLADWHWEGLKTWFANRRPWAKTAVICTLALLVLVFGMYGLGFEASAFIYGGF